MADIAPAPTPPPEPPAPPKPDPTPAPAPKPATPPPPAVDATDPFADMDARIARNRGKEPPAPEPKPEPKPGDAPPKPDAPPPKHESGPKALREQLEKTNTELKTKQTQIDDLTKKITDAEKLGKDVTALTERLSARDKEYEALQAKLSAKVFEASDSYKKTYQQPFEDAAETAKREINQLVIATGPDGANRAANFDRDFASLYQMPRHEARARANELFGDDAAIVMEHYTALHRLSDSQARALKAEQDGWSAKHEAEEKAETARQAQARENVQNMWVAVNKDLSEKNEDYSDKPDAPKDEVAARKEAYQVYDARPQTIQERVVKDAQIRHRAAAFTVMKLRVQRLNEEVADLKAKLAAKANGEPGDTLTPGPGDTPPPQTWKQELAEALKP